MTPPPSPATVCIVDDDARTAHALAGLLAMDGLAVEVHDAAAIDERLAWGDLPAGLVMTVSMARADDVRTVHRITATHPSLPVVLVTEYPHLATRLAPLSAVFTKPVDYPALLDLLRAILDARAARPPMQTTQTRETPW